ncbi:excalibur calcium-binding domain-containing protein [Corynebacterium stationis]|uniref:excalibur calcium-binding domain-containing protein n=1 Tax=Corynebacterium stationis TaxID=1705 RepID=UPI00076F90FF|nr:excalibur calcium-binding domain-containing protein [Corynebacterium stationis]AMJ44228.1 hypothetical protein AW169_04380 [Corynebacterium stationis]HJG63465.1 excalibur calcium-binding domain-containing protein [Corynebacterium stationis]
MPVCGKVLRRVLAIATIAIAALIALVSLAPPLSIPGLFAALGFFVPGGWWFYCESKDKKARATHQQRVQAQAHWNEHLDPVKDQAILAGLGTPLDGPQLFRRRWGWAFFTAFVAFAIAMVLTPETPATSETKETEESSSATTTPSETTTSTTTSSSSSSTTKSEPTSTYSSTTTQEPEPEQTTQRVTEEPYVEQQSGYTPAPEPTPAPQQFYQQPAAPVVQESPSVYYQNCDAVRAAGAAPLYIGSPGYASKLDRDGDGVACE